MPTQLDTEVVLKFRFNTQTDELEVLANENVVASTGPEFFKQCVDYYTDKHKPAPVVVDEPVQETVVTVTPEPAPAAPAPEVVAEPVAVVDKTTEPVVD